MSSSTLVSHLEITKISLIGVLILASSHRTAIQRGDNPYRRHICRGRQPKTAQSRSQGANGTSSNFSINHEPRCVPICPPNHRMVTSPSSPPQFHSLDDLQRQQTPCHLRARTGYRRHRWWHHNRCSPHRQRSISPMESHLGNSVHHRDRNPIRGVERNVCGKFCQILRRSGEWIRSRSSADWKTIFDGC